MPMKPQESVFDFKEVLSEFCGEHASVWLYHREEDFNKLWQLGSKHLDKPIVIFWKGFPNGAQQASAALGQARTNWYVSPYHWALTLACRCLREGRATVPRLYVLHWIPVANEEDWDSFGRQCRSISTAVPWLLGVSLLDPSPESGLQPLEALKQIAPGQLPTPTDGVLSLLKAALRKQVADDPDDRHTIANLVGPSLLAAAFGEADPNHLPTSTNPSSRALTQLLRGLEWLPASGQAPPSKSIGEGHRYLCGRDPLRGLRTDQTPQIRYYLLDDQASAGYANVLANILSATAYRSGDSLSTSTGTNSLCWSESPDELLSWLRACSSNGRIGYINGIDVLFLDLRLWLGDITSEHARGVLKKIIKVVDDLKLLDESVDSQLQEAFSAASVCSNDGRHSYAEELAAVTLLPLLLSHCDPSLPVIVFSSTRQREVTYRLRHRPNIQCQFTKPFLLNNEGTASLSGAAEGQPVIAPTPLQPSADQLTAAVLGALAQVRLRPIWRRIVDLQLNAPEYNGDDGSASGAFQGLRETKSIYRHGCWTTRVNFMTAKFRLSPPRTIRRLQQLFFRLVRGDVDALLSGCYELIEAGYSTDRQKRESNELKLFLTNNRAVSSDPHEIQQYRFTLLAMAIQEIRHFKAHALHRHADPNLSEGNAIQFACAAMMLALIDFLEQRSDATIAITRQGTAQSVLVRGHPPWHVKEHAAQRTPSDAAFVMSVLITALDTAAFGCRGFVVPPNIPNLFFSKELVGLCNSIIQDESLLKTS